jgi:competence protein ComEA
MRMSYVSLAVLLLGALLAAGAGAGTVTRAVEATVAAAAGGPVNINTADVKQLMTLEGVGQKVAEKIVEYRTEHGPFRKPEEIRKVQGIGGGLWEKNRERIVVK